MNTKNFFETAKKEGIETLELAVKKNTNISMELYHGELVSYSISDTSSVNARGIYLGKLGAAGSSNTESEGLAFLLNEIKATALINETKESPEIFKGSPKYVRGNVFNQKLKETKITDKIALIREIEKRLGSIDPRIVDVMNVSYSETISEYILENSFGLKLKSKSNHCYVYAEVKAQDGDSVKVGGDFWLDNDLDKFDIDAFCKQVADDALLKLHGKAPWDKKKTYAILHQDVVGALLEAFISSMVADAVQKKSSLLAGKLNTQVASKRITLEEKPLIRNVFFRSFDDEGVATYNKKLIEKGILKTYLYNLQTAKKDGVTTTANGYRSGNNIGTDVGYVVLKPGRLTLEEMLAKDLRDGVYVTSVSGLHAGLNSQSGDFSLEAQGFLIKDGKIAQPLGLITVAGNLIKLFENVVLVGGDSKSLPSGMSVPSLKIKSLSFSA